MPVRKDYTAYSLFLSLSVIGLLLLMGNIPPLKVFGLKTKRINIMSDIYASNLQHEEESQEQYSDTTFNSESMAALSSENIEQALNIPVGKSQSWDVISTGLVATPHDAVGTVMPGDYSSSAQPNSQDTDTQGSTAVMAQNRVDPATYEAPTTMVEDFSPTGKDMNYFYRLLRNGQKRRPVRIAVLGDSFIEADILTADLREQMQQVYSGSGVGFVPFSSPLAKYRGTVKHTFEGWESYNVIKKKSAPDFVKDKFFISGLACIPSEGAWTKIEGVNFRKNIRSCTVARLLFMNTKNSVISVTINDTVQSQFTPESSPLVQQINIRGNIYSIKVKITSAEGFVGYGVVMESERGVSVDNYSIRGNSGMALFGTNTAINAQMGKLLGFDMVVLQYGLNAMSPDILNYNSYSGQLQKIISYIRECFPGAVVMVMSVGDRSTQNLGEYVTMPAAKAMLNAQHVAAQRGGAAFWNTFQAMGGERSMVRFVEKKWAARDYTHIGYSGGKYIATELMRSLLYGYRSSNGDLDIESIVKPDSAASLPAAAKSVNLPASRSEAVNHSTVSPATVAPKDTTSVSLHTEQPKEQPSTAIKPDSTSNPDR